MLAILSVVLLCTLFFFSRQLTEGISFFLYRLTRSHTLAIQLLAILFLPGVIIHELSHWLVASILFVPTGEIEFFPQVTGQSVKLGSVQVAKTDPVRRFFIGVAPLIMGSAVLLGIFWFLDPSLTALTAKTGIFFYCLFEIGNTMFSSRKDLEGIIGFLIIVFLLTTLLVFLHVPLIPFLQEFFASETVVQGMVQLIKFLLIAIGIDCLVLLMLSGLYGLRRLFTLRSS